MSESDILATMTDYFGLVADMLSLYLTATTGYLIVIYLVGIKLTRSQLAIISGLYLAFALIATYLTIAYGLRGMHYADELRKVNADVPVYSRVSIPTVLAAVLLVGIGACLKFMWDVRHRDTD
jgi:hypothetical protein